MKMRLAVKGMLSVGSLLAGLALAGTGAIAQTKTLKIQASWPNSSTQYDNLTDLAKRVEQVTSGRVKIEAMPAGQVVPAFEVLDATHKKVLDGAHTWPGYWVGKNKAALLFSGGPGGPWGMDHIDFLGWMWHGGGLEKFHKFYRETLKLNVISFLVLTASPQAVGWFKKPIDSLADLKGQKCRQTGMAAEIYNEMGMRTVNMPGGEIMPAAERGTIDCAEWVGGIEDLRFGFHTLWKYHYAPSLHESVSFAEIMFNADTWKELQPADQEAIKAVITEQLFFWWTRWQSMNADALVEFREKHKINLLNPPADLAKEFLAAWDRVAAKEAEKNPIFKEIMEDQKKWASRVVPMKKFYFPNYSVAADYYWPDKK
jgi:TRAP-type mannitol/chloroaromatic compound transport system substrate-binding protein